MTLAYWLCLLAAACADERSAVLDELAGEEPWRAAELWDRAEALLGLAGDLAAAAEHYRSQGHP